MVPWFICARKDEFQSDNATVDWLFPSQLGFNRAWVRLVLLFSAAARSGAALASSTGATGDPALYA